MSHETVSVLPHNYDGIEEFDNRLPNWWLMTLFSAIVFGAGYWVYFETAGVGLNAMEQFEIEQQVAAKEAAVREAAEAKANPITDAMLDGLAADAATVAEGKKVWTTNCVACHGATGAGLVGPNLTDAFWVHGHQSKAIFAVVAHGVPAKGMPAWQPALGMTKTKAVTAFVLSLRNTNVKGKAPQGVDADGKSAGGS